MIQQQGAERIVVQLPGVQDVTRAKRLIGRTATLEIRMVAEEYMNPETLAAAARGQVPFGTEYYVERNGQPLLVRRQVVLTGDRLTDAQPGFDSQTNEPAVHCARRPGRAHLPGGDAREREQAHGDPADRKGQGRSHHRAGDPQRDSRRAGADLRAHEHHRGRRRRAAAARRLLAAPMEIVEERTVGPSLGRDNIEKGFNATMWGFIVIVAFMSVYYAAFGMISSLALAVNLLFLIALLSLLQATLTLRASPPSRSRSAWRSTPTCSSTSASGRSFGGATPQAVAAGYERAWARSSTRISPR